MAARGAEYAGRPGGRVDDPGDVGEAATLVGAVVDRVIIADRVLDADAVVQVFAGDEIIDLADPAAPFEARLQPFVRAAIHRDRAARHEAAGLGLDVDDAGGAEAVLRRQCAGD